jgi:small subunit ribosomal protein S17
MPRKKKEETVEETNAEVVETEVEETTEAVEAKAEATEEKIEAQEEKPKKTKAKKAEEEKAEESKADKPKGDANRGSRAARVGVVTSDKMMKTVVVRVDRLVKHPKYRKYVRRKKQFMAHDELGASIGDKVKIVETRPLSARKRWRVVEIVQKAAK